MMTNMPTVAGPQIINPPSLNGATIEQLGATSEANLSPYVIGGAVGLVLGGFLGFIAARKYGKKGR